MHEHPEINPDPTAATWSDLRTTWERRGKIAAQWLIGQRSVVDIGCGLMTLRAHLPPGTRYIGVDVVRRDVNTIVTDLNNSRLPPIDAEVAVMLGVLEYVANVSEVLDQLKRFPSSLVSYNHASVKDLVWTLRIKPKSVNWKNHYSRAEFRRIVQKAGLSVIRERRLRLGERLYQLAAKP